MAGVGKAHLRDHNVLLRVEDLVVEYPSGNGGKVHAVSGISFDILNGETLGLVGESGCGKSTTGRAVLQLPRPTGGSVNVDELELTSLPDADMRIARTRMQMIFQDPVSALNPRRKVRDIVKEPLVIWNRDKESADLKVDEMLDRVGLNATTVGERRPHEFSGGQCQRIAIARSLMLEPELLICDEPVSALDVSVQAQILNLLEDLKERYGLSMLFIAHDVAVVKNISDRIAVMYMGKMCEVGPSESIVSRPAHPYTKALIDAVPVPDPDAIIRSTRMGEPPSPINPPSGCRFSSRCPKAQEKCSEEEPIVRMIGRDHFVACHFPDVEIEPEEPALAVSGSVTTGADAPDLNAP